MLLACIQDKKEIEEVHSFCDGVELQEDPKKILLFNGQSFVDLPWQTPFEESQKRIASYHNFKETPRDLEALFQEMQQQPAYAYKIVTMACSTLDSLRMLAFVRRIHQRGYRIIGLCMGEKGAITRIVAPIMGGLWNYAYVKIPAAPGQFSLEALAQLKLRSFSSRTAIYGLIGNPVVQSPSFRTHNAFFRKRGLDAVYVPICLQAEELVEGLQLMREIGFQGLSVTIPYKEKLIPFLHSIEPVAKEIGAINTIRFTEEGLHGYNTDAAGGIDALRQNLQGKRLVCLGAGGAAKALAYEARLRGAEVFLLNRASLSKGLPEKYDILINVTPTPSPIDPLTILPGSTVMEINTHFVDTPFLQVAKERGCKIILGMEMFWRQALGQFKHWGLIEGSSCEDISLSF